MIPLFLLCLCAFDVRLKVVTYHLSSEKIETPLRLALVADLHGCYYGEGQKTLVNAINNANPDLILLGGDIFDDALPYDHAETLLANLTHYPCYYVSGNHEYWSYDMDTIWDILDAYQVTVLDGTQLLVEIHGETIQLAGVSDPDMPFYGGPQETTQDQLQAISPHLVPDYYSVLLAHRPERIAEYKEYPFDLVLSGHAHGGQWRIPGLINGIYSPNQGLFPPYAGGLYTFPGLDFVVSRGLARETTQIPRIFNRPELVILDID